MDDEPLISDLLKCGVESHSYKVSAVNNGLKALYLMAEEYFDMVFMDIRMPVMDGLAATTFLRKCEQGEYLSLADHSELAQSLHSRRNGTRLPVVAVTGNIDDREIMLQAGIDEFIPKPFKLNSIYDMLDMFCGKSTKESTNERRKHTRYPITGEVLVRWNKGSGRVVDISTGGMALNILDNSGPLPKKWTTDFYSPNTRIEGLPLKLVREEAIETFNFGNKMQTIGVEFDNPTVLQQTQIRQHLCQ